MEQSAGLAEARGSWVFAVRGGPPAGKRKPREQNRRQSGEWEHCRNSLLALPLQPEASAAKAAPLKEALPKLFPAPRGGPTRPP